MRLLAATGNQGKLREIEGLLAGSGIELVAQSELDNPPVVEEDGATFAANACKKATVMATRSGLLTVADDSGLVVAALDGRPGVLSARYAGEPSDDRANNAKLLQDLKEVPDAQRQAAFHCVIALAWPDGRCRTFKGEVPGRILSVERGSGGFGYDPLFLVPEYGLTMAELPLEIKNRISHRGRALRQLIPVLKEMAGQSSPAPGSA